MAVYKQTYRDYDGPITAVWSRFVILSRFSYSRLFQSRSLVLFMAVCLFYPIGCAAYIYLTHSSPLIAALSLQPGTIPPIDGSFFYSYCLVQGTMAFLLTTLIGPSLVAPDLANGALCLYLSRPFSRTQYVFGKMMILLSLQSLVTWIPGLLLYFIKVGCAGWDWGRTNIWLAGAIVIGLGVWIVALSLIALAISAWVKWKIAAGALILGVFFAGAGFGNAVNSILRTRYGSAINLSEVIHTIWADLFRHGFMDTDLTTPEAWMVLGVMCAFCLGLLAKRVRAFEVVK
jgi:ABC-2 type transport system permease protein